MHWQATGEALVVGKVTSLAAAVAGNYLFAGTDAGCLYVAAPRSFFYETVFDLCVWDAGTGLTLSRLSRRSCLSPPPLPS